MKKSTIIILALIVSANVFGQSKPRKVTVKKDSTTVSGFTGIHTFTGVSTGGYLPPDTVLCYFNEITGVQDGKLITQWVKGYRVDKQSNNWVYYTNTGSEFYYSDKKTKVSNKVIQSY